MLSTLLRKFTNVFSYSVNYCYRTARFYLHFEFSGWRFILQVITCHHPHTPGGSLIDWLAVLCNAPSSSSLIELNGLVMSPQWVPFGGEIHKSFSCLLSIHVLMWMWVLLKESMKSISRTKRDCIEDQYGACVSWWLLCNCMGFVSSLSAILPQSFRQQPLSRKLAL